MNRYQIISFDEPYARHIINIRRTVFTGEQGIDTRLDFDGSDPEAAHVLVRAGDLFVGTGRLLADGHIGRLAVLKEFRGQGYGSDIIRGLIDQAKQLGLTRVFLGAQMSALGFYRKLDFNPFGDPFIEAGIEHVHMERNLD